MLQQSKGEFALFWNIPVNQLKWLKQKHFETVHHQSEILIRTTRQWKRLVFFVLCFYCFLSSVTLPVSLPRAPLWGRQTSSTVSESCETHKCLASTLTRLLSQVAVTTATGRVCSYPKNWSVLNLEHGVTSFELGGTTSIIDPLRVRRRWVIERKSISDRNPKTLAAQLPRQRLFLPRRLTAHSLISSLSATSLFRGRWHRRRKPLNEGTG